MNRLGRVAALFLIFAVSFVFPQEHLEKIDLAKIGPIAPKGRVQDAEYNPDLPVVAALIQAGPKAIDFLVGKLTDETIIHTHVMDFWSDVRVSDVAWFVLCDFFTTPDWRHSTVQPPLGSINSTYDPDLPAQENWGRLIKQIGRKGIQRRVRRILNPYRGRLYWDWSWMCFRPKLD